MLRQEFGNTFAVLTPLLLCFFLLLMLSFLCFPRLPSVFTEERPEAQEAFGFLCCLAFVLDLRLRRKVNTQQRGKLKIKRRKLPNEVP
jgi:hypothetical protein